MPASTSSPSPSLQRLAPPDLQIAQVSVPGFAALSTQEQLRSLAFALNRDLGISGHSLRLAAQASQNDRVLVAFTHLKPATRQNFATDLFAATRDPETVYWVGAPGGYVISSHGAVPVDAEADWPNLPVALSSLLAAQPQARDLILVDAKPDLSIEQKDFWQATSGLVLREGHLPSGPLLPLLAPSQAETQAPRQPLDRALLAFAVISVLAALLALFTWGQSKLTAPVTAASANSTTTLNGGILFNRILLAAPEISSHLQSANFASGTWVIALSAPTEPEQVRALVRRLEDNGLAVQYVTQPDTRLRISLP